MATKTNSELETEIIDIKKKMNQILTAIQNLASKKTLQQLQLLRSGDIADLKKRVTNLEQDVETLRR